MPLEQHALFALLLAKHVQPLLELASHVSMLILEISARIANASMDTSITMRSIALNAHQLARHAHQLLPALLVLPIAIEFSKEMYALVLLDTMSYTTLINQEHAKNVILNVLLAMYLLLTASLVIQLKIEFLELTSMVIQLVFVILVFILLKMGHVFNLTAMLIHSAHNANKGLNFASNVLPLKTESLNFLKVFVFAWMDFIQTSTIIVSLAQVDV
jgi:hypothetical protein